MTFSLAAIGIAAEGTGSEFTLSAKVESDGALVNAPLYVKAGDVIKYVVSVDSNPGALHQIEIFANFDTDKLLLQSVTIGSIFDLDKVALVRDRSIERSNEMGEAQVWVLADDDSKSDKTGAFVTFEFKLNADYDGKIDDKLVSFEASYSVGAESLKDYNLATPVAHAHHYGEPTPKAGTCVTPGATVYECTVEGCTDAKLSISTGELGDHDDIKDVPRTEPTEDREGCEAHKRCYSCGQLFDADGKEIDSYPSIPKLEKTKNNTAVTVIIIVVAVVVVAAGAAAAVVVLKKKKII